MTDFAKRYVVPVLRGSVEADRVLSYAVENAVYAFCDTLSKKGLISPHFLHKEAKEFLEARNGQQVEGEGLLRCRGKTAKNAACSNKPQWHGFCKVHEDQYTAKVREADRVKRAAETVIVHRGHGPDVEFLEGCPGCAKKRAAAKPA
jgi:hypothetical protein